jgi:hypothetical protein
LRACNQATDTDDALKMTFLKEVLNDRIAEDYLVKLGKRFDSDLYFIIESGSSSLCASDDARKLKDSQDCLFTIVLAYYWLVILGECPTFMSDNGKYRIFEPSAFQSFVAALPLGKVLIKDETIRTAVESVRKNSARISSALLDGPSRQ